MKCRICNRLLKNEFDPLSKDCGEDCLGCMIYEEQTDNGSYTYLEVRLRNRIINLEQEIRDFLTQLS